MKRMFLMAVLALALPVAGFASSVDFTDSGGTLSGTNAGLSLTGSTLIAINGMGTRLLTGDLGSVTFTTGALVTGNLQTGGVFAAGGSFVITGNGKDGLPDGVIFTGSFDCSSSSPCKWEQVNHSNHTHYYAFIGPIKGTWLNTGKTVDGAIVQLTISTGKKPFNGSVTLSSGDISIAVPEPGTLGLLGTGLLGLAAAIHRKFKA